MLDNYETESPSQQLTQARIRRRQLQQQQQQQGGTTNLHNINSSLNDTTNSVHPTRTKSFPTGSAGVGGGSVHGNATTAASGNHPGGDFHASIHFGGGFNSSATHHDDSGFCGIGVGVDSTVAVVSTMIVAVRV